MKPKQVIEQLQEIKQEIQEELDKWGDITKENGADPIPDIIDGQEKGIQALDIAIDSLEHQVNEKDEIKLVCPKCKREWTKPIGEFCSSCGTEMVVEPYERKE